MSATANNDPNWNWNFAVNQMSTQLSASGLQNPSWVQNPTNWVGNSGGQYIYSPPISQNEGADLLTLLAPVGLSDPFFAIGLSFASILVTFGQTSSGPTTGVNGPNLNTAYQSYNGDGQGPQALSMLMGDNPLMPNQVYTIQFQATIQFQGYGGIPWPYTTSLTVSNSFTYTVS